MKSNNLVNVLEVASFNESAQHASTPKVDYLKTEDLFAGVRFIHECGGWANFYNSWTLGN